MATERGVALAERHPPVAHESVPASMNRSPRLLRLMPFLRWWPYQGVTLRADFIGT
jgi:hypothetical protein